MGGQRKTFHTYRSDSRSIWESSSRLRFFLPENVRSSIRKNSATFQKWLQPTGYIIHFLQVAEKEAKRCLTTVSWLINQMETLNPPDQGASTRRFSERDLDAVISVFQDLFGSDEPLSPDGETPPWRMRLFGVDGYFLEQDLQYPLDPAHSDFQPYYDTLVNNIECVWVCLSSIELSPEIRIKTNSNILTSFGISIQFFKISVQVISSISSFN